MRSRYVQSAHDTINKTNLFDAIWNVGWVTINLFATCHLTAGSHANHFAIFVDNFVNLLVQHVGATVNGAQTGETLR